MIWKQPQWHIPPLFSENTEKSVAAWENGRREKLLAKLAETIYGITPAQTEPSLCQSPLSND